MTMFLNFSRKKEIQLNKIIMGKKLDEIENSLIQGLFQKYAKLPFIFDNITGNTTDEIIEKRVELGFDAAQNIYINNVMFNDNIPIERYMELNIFVIESIIKELQLRNKEVDYEFLAIMQKMLHYIDNDDIIEIDFEDDN